MKTPFVVGIAGGSASGKTTLAQRLENALAEYSPCVLHMDHYFKETLPKGVSPQSGKEYDDYNAPSSFDLARFQHDLCAVIESGEHAVVIAEGLLTLWDNTVYDRLDLRLFVDCRADERIVRRLKRNMDYGMAFGDVAEVYLDLVRYRHEEFVEPTKWRADLILNGSMMADTVLDMLVHYIHSKV